MYNLHLIIGSCILASVLMIGMPITVNAQSDTNTTQQSSLNLDQVPDMGLVGPGETVHVFVCPQGVTNPSGCQYFFGEPAQMTASP